ncbi:GTPase HflX [Candidatus Phycosocius spiralis]|uniref:GTPase HflX n=1 Tax=Candidatus Phycosocius spiralis TaxID=2815099 RepID=A0ABQ4PSI7_9PROT|nr:GTPase HflX [Candidatus Phycosocius spiralis]GIU65966.1 GTPase HflX [Candidatus Phycosocius spiralis]
MIDQQDQVQRAILIHTMRYEGLDYRDPDLRLIEAQGLAEALDLIVVDSHHEPVRKIRPGAYFGIGKIEELKALAESLNADVLILDDQLSPIQQRNLEKALQIKVIDRTGLILEIFARRARTREGVLQVELARLSYEKSRLVKTWTHLERQRGGTGKTGGPGERQIELDRRMIADKILKLKKELEDVKRTRALQRASRKRVPYPVIALVGYTNAGKSTLFNLTASADVLAKDMPFATLDTTLRAVRTPSGRDVILSDTVGFITDLPTELVAAFRATLEEVAQADLLVHVRDISHAESDNQKRDVELVLDRIVKDMPVRPPLIEVWNKVDTLDDQARTYVRGRAAASGRDGTTQSVCVSALTGEGVKELFDLIDHELALDAKPLNVMIGPDQGAARAWLFRKGAVRHEITDEDGAIHLQVRLNEHDAARFVAQWPQALDSQALPKTYVSTSMKQKSIGNCDTEI